MQAMEAVRVALQDNSSSPTATALPAHIHQLYALTHAAAGNGTGSGTDGGDGGQEGEAAQRPVTCLDEAIAAVGELVGDAAAAGRLAAGAQRAADDAASQAAEAERRATQAAEEKERLEVQWQAASAKAAKARVLREAAIVSDNTRRRETKPAITTATVGLPTSPFAPQAERQVRTGRMREGTRGIAAVLMQWHHRQLARAVRQWGVVVAHIKTAEAEAARQRAEAATGEVQATLDEARRIAAGGLLACGV